VDCIGNAYVTGSTKSAQPGFPVVLGPDLTYNGMGDAYVAKVNAAGTGLDYCSYIGGTDGDCGQGIAVDRFGNAYVSGYTDSLPPGFPVEVGPDLTYNNGGDAFVAKVAMALAVDAYEVSAGTGGTIEFALNAGASKANRNYLLLGSISGTVPGFTLPGGFATLPLNWDGFTDVVLLLINTPIFSNFLASLDGLGRGTAKLNAPPLPPNFVGLTMYYAYCLGFPWEFVSNPIQIVIVP
jgi:hypothetical protein